MSDKIHDLFSVEGKIIVLTGGVKGIGAMIRATLLDAGAKVIVVARSDVPASAQHKNCTYLKHDLATTEGLEAAVADVAAHAPQVDVLINNAGSLTMAGMALTAEQWDREIAINMRAPFFLTQQLMPQLKQSSKPGDPARVINIGSIAGQWGKSSGSYAYSASKGGLHQMTRALASDLTREGVNVNAIAPGFFPSDLTDGFFSAAEGLREQVIAGIPAGRLGAADDIGGAVIYLSSRASNYVSGSILFVDGAIMVA